MNHLPNIAMYGGKAASLLAQFQKGNTDLLFPFTIDIVAEREKGNIPSYNFKYDQIVRGSAVGDERTLVDTIPTLRKVSPSKLNDQAWEEPGRGLNHYQESHIRENSMAWSNEGFDSADHYINHLIL